MKVKKFQTEVYKLRHETKSIWADISIDAGEKSGSISIISDFGNWSYRWGSTGEFKKFLTKIDMYYTAGKFGCGRYLDVDKTVEMYKRDLLQSRKGENISEEDAREVFDEIVELGNTVSNGEDSAFQHVLWSSSKLMEYFDHMPDTCTDVHPLFKRFWNEIWPFFVAMLQEEISEVKAA